MTEFTNAFKKLLRPNLPEKPEIGMRWGESKNEYAQVIGVRDDQILLMDHYPHVEYIANWQEFYDAALKGEDAPCKLSKGWDALTHQKHATFFLNTRFQGLHQAVHDVDIQNRRQLLEVMSMPLL